MKKQNWEIEFDKELTISHPGDSGFGGFNGGDPQEATYEMAADPNDVKAFIRKWIKKAKNEGFNRGIDYASKVIKGRELFPEDSVILKIKPLPKNKQIKFRKL